MASKKVTIESVMRDQAIAQFPNEACGVVISVGKKGVAVSCRNVSHDPKNYFVIDADDYAEAADRGEVIGVWHTHPNRTAAPSEADIVGCENSGVPWYILGVGQADNGEFVFDGPTVTKPSGFEMPYLGRPYVFGVMDCYSLVRDYYKREFKIMLGDGPRIEFFWKGGVDLLTKGSQDQRLLPQIGKEPQNGDLFLITTEGSVPNHVAIYIGDDMIMHHCHGRLSKRDVYAGYWYKHTTAHLRFIDFCK